MATPLPNHVGPNVNAIIKELGMKIKTRVDEVHKVMVRMRAIIEKNFFERMCCYF